MKEEKTYEIYTDASFDDETKLGTYAIVIIQENSIVKIIAKKCRIRLEKSTDDFMNRLEKRIVKNLDIKIRENS